jgi:hypothetical protein
MATIVIEASGRHRASPDSAAATRVQAAQARATPVTGSATALAPAAVLRVRAGSSVAVDGRPVTAVAPVAAAAGLSADDKTPSCL